MASLSVVIPTFNRATILEKVLRGFVEQDNSTAIGELIVVDDGSSDETPAVTESFIKFVPFPVRYLCQDNRGPAAARNYGTREARHEIVLFVDDDVEPQRSLIRRHASWHKDHHSDTDALLGYVTWAPEVNATPFMKWYGEKGALFAYSLLVPNAQVDFRRLYTCNVSFKRRFLLENGCFDEDFKDAAYEDFELAYRLHQKGLTLFYDSLAVGFHHQRFTFRDACCRAERVASGYKILVGKQAFHALPVKRGIATTMAKILLRVAAPMLAPFRSALDSRIRFPDWIYRAFYSSYADQALRRAINLARTPGTP